MIFPESMYHWIEKSTLPIDNYIIEKKEEIIYFEINFLNDKNYFNKYKEALQIILNELKQYMIMKHMSYLDLVLKEKKLVM